jgi:predicted transcriptional regulator YheO
MNHFSVSLFWQLISWIIEKIFPTKEATKEEKNEIIKFLKEKGFHFEGD